MDDLKKKIKNLSGYPLYLIVRVMVCIVQSLSVETCAYFGKWMAFFLSDIIRFRRRLVLSNLRKSFPDWSEEKCVRTMREMWEHLVLLAIEIMHTPRKIYDTNWREFIRLYGVRKMLAYLNREHKPVVMITGHFGNFEVGGYILGLLGYPTHAVARPLDNPYLDRYLKSFRESTGQYLITKVGASTEIIETLENEEIVAFLVDQAALGKKDIWVEFFGQPAKTFKAISLVALQFNALAAVAYAVRRKFDQPMRFDVHVPEILDAAVPSDDTLGPHEFTHWFTKVLEQEIRKYPEQYWWVHKRWKRNEGITLDQCVPKSRREGKK